ncbi:helix-turn-helix domain-containing protein [Paludibacterium purpuratum]|uniref:Transcriptional regulator GlxA family with amidase domain n=1 Tax=Paludibacterium purpuratum TaxID=1144873 RepID=A0A4V3DUL8_9NEIS|nr:helix-turn-helix domain-containing protein [Paludibacterium purpuratum]TDR73870.1 transcriptional regulator GlxA family with amidase domain [Paludibacterium purpuratum]
MTLRVAVLAFDRISPFHLSVPCVVFGEARPELADIVFHVCAEHPGMLTSSVGVGLSVAHGLDVLSAADMVIVPSWADLDNPPSPALSQALRAAHARGARLVGLCLGAYALAWTGLLDGRRATTHWAYADDFATRFPRVGLSPDVLYLDEGDIVTSAGTAAGLDCCLHLLRQHIGMARANQVARRLVVAPQRQGGQAQFIEQPLPQPGGDARLGGLIDWVRAHLDQPHSLDSLAERALMGRRTLTRRFHRLTGMTVGEWLLSERLSQAQHLLESSDRTVEAVAALVGFATGASLRQHFRQRFGVSPQQWRQTFRVCDDSGAAQQPPQRLVWD